MIFSLLIACNAVEPESVQRNNDLPEVGFGEGELDPDLHIPSSFIQLEHHTLESMKESIKTSIKEERKLYKNFGRRSRSPIIADGLNLQPTDILADIGAGTGAFDLLLLEEDYQFEKLYVIDVDKAPLNFFSWVTETAGIDDSRIEIVHSKMSSITLPASSITKALLLNTPFYIDDKGKPTNGSSAKACMKTIVEALKPEGELHIVERHVGEKEEDIKIGDPPEMHCSSLVDAFTPLGLVLTKMEIIPITNKGEPPHCRVILSKPNPASGK